MQIKLLHIEDDAIVRDAVQSALESQVEMSITVHQSKDFESIKNDLNEYNLVVLDLHLSRDNEAEGVEILKQLKKHKTQLPVIIYSSDLKLIRKTMQMGADDFIFKSHNLDDFNLRVLHFIESKCLPRKDVAQDALFAGDTMLQIQGRIEKVVPSSVRSIFINGETGTGKEAVADLIEAALPKNSPFVRINCAAVTPSLIESELFGHMKGAFTGASKDRRGFFEAAQNGWLFLDEITCLPEATQAKLLRAIENQEISRVGETATRKVNVKIVAASNENIEEMIQEKKFRADLWNRINETIIELPPLRHRKKEIAAIIDHLGQAEEGGPYKIAEEAKAILTAAEWTKGNIRELRSCLRAMTAYHVDKTLVPAGIPQWFWDQYGDEPQEPQGHEQSTQSGEFKIDFSRGFEFASDQLLIKMIKDLSQKPGTHSLRRMAERLKLPKSTLANRIRKAIDHGVVSEEDVKKLWTK